MAEILQIDNVSIKRIRTGSGVEAKTWIALRIGFAGGDKGGEAYLRLSRAKGDELMRILGDTLVDGGQEVADRVAQAVENTIGKVQ